jgi:hypothetical protein
MKLLYLFWMEEVSTTLWTRVQSPSLWNVATITSRFSSVCVYVDNMGSTSLIKRKFQGFHNAICYFCRAVSHCLAFRIVMYEWEEHT